MAFVSLGSRTFSARIASARIGPHAVGVSLLLVFALSAVAQTTPAAPGDTLQVPPQLTPAPPAAPAPFAAPDRATEPPQPGAMNEEELKRLLVGKPLYLRGGYLDNSLSFNEHGALIGHSPQGSYTLNGVQIERVRLTKHKVELDGKRYGLHFLGALPYEDPTKAVDRVNITPKKKQLHISIDRELVATPKKKHEKENGKGKGKRAAAAAASRPVVAAAPPPQPLSPALTSSSPEAEEPSAAEQAKAEIAAAPPAERPADPGSITTTNSPAHAAKVLKDALDKIFASGFDGRMMAAMPAFWKLYYEAAAAKRDYRPSDPAVLHQSMVDKKARLVTTFEPESNEYAQSNGVAGMALYHAVIGADGKPGEIAVGRPIGFGLDENAVEAIRKAAFEPAVKDGHPVPVVLDLVVEFRIYSKRTAAQSQPQPAGNPAAPVLPGPYSVQHP